jgi:hypothetical protein
MNQAPMPSKSSMRPNHGQVLIIVMVLISALSFAAASMAMAVSSNLQTVGVATGLDAKHYAAESAVTRGAAATMQSQPCAAGGSLNRQSFTTSCQPQVNNVDTSSSGMAQVPVPPAKLASGQCISIPLSFAAQRVALWTVLGWRGNAIDVWADDSTDCTVPGKNVCGQKTLNSSPAFYNCYHGTGKGVDGALHVAADGGSVDLAAFDVRLAAKGSDSVVTVIGQSGVEVDEADVITPVGGSPAVTFWNTVLP